MNAEPVRDRAADDPAVLCYVESSALLSALLEHDVKALATLSEKTVKVTSALTFAETYRAVLRARLDGRLNVAQERTAIRAIRTFERRCTVIDVSATVPPLPFPANSH